MKKVRVIELVNTTTNEILGYSPLIEERGKKSKMIIDGDGPITFKTRDGTKTHGLEHIK